MLRILLIAVMLAASATASAQLYRWVDKDGRVHYTDKPPPAGVKARTLAVPSGPAAPAPSGDGEGTPDAAAKDAAAKDAAAAPLTPAQQEQAFRKRQLEAQQAAEKAEQARREQQIKEANCARAREALATYESGQRVARTNAQGERYYLEDAERAREADSARQAVRDWCG